MRRLMGLGEARNLIGHGGLTPTSAASAAVLRCCRDSCNGFISFDELRWSVSMVGFFVGCNGFLILHSIPHSSILLCSAPLCSALLYSAPLSPNCRSSLSSDLAESDLYGQI